MFSFATKFSPEAANFEKAVFAGYEFAELFLTPTRLMSWRSLSKIARSYELGYALHYPTSGKLTRQTSEEIVSLARDLNCRFITVHEEQLEQARSIHDFDPNLRLSIENQGVRYDDLDTWMLAHEAVTLDVDDLWRSTLQQADFSELLSVVKRVLHRFGAKVTSLHLSGFHPQDPTHRSLSQASEMVEMLWDTIYQENFSGFVVAELDPSQQDSTLLKADAELYRNWRERKGIPCLLDSSAWTRPESRISETL